MGKKDGAADGGGMTPSERTMQARLAAHVLHSKHDSRELTKKARAAFDARFEKQVDPDGVLPEAERLRRAAHARKAYFAALQLKSAKARKSKRS